MRHVSERLDRLRASMRTLFAADGAARLVLAMGLFIAVSFIIDYALSLPSPVRVVVLLAGLGFFGWVIAKRLVYPLSVTITDDDLAIFVERHYPELSDRLISAIQLSRAVPAVPSAEGIDEGIAYNSPELVEALIRDAEQATAALDFNRVIIGRHVGRIAIWGLLTALVLTSLGVRFHEYSSIYLNRVFGGKAKWPQRIRLEILDFDAQTHRRVIARGEDTVIAVQVHKVNPAVSTPSKVVLEYRFDTGEHGTERMNPTSDDRFTYTFSRVTGPFTFTVRGGDDETEVHRVDTLTPPSIEEIHLFYRFPKYMHKNDTPDDQPVLVGNVSAPLHTHVLFTAHSNEDLSEAVMAIGLKGKEETIPLKITADAKGLPRTLQGEFDVKEAYAEWSITLTAKNGLKNRDPIRFTIRGQEDRPPEIAMKDPSADEDVTEICARPLLVEVTDDHGIASIHLEYRILGTQRSTDWQIVKFGAEENTPREYGEKKIACEYVIDLGKLKVVPSDSVEFRIVAQDYKNIAPLNVTVSKSIKLNVKTITEIDKALQEQIDRVKASLEQQKKRELGAWERTGKLEKAHGAADTLTIEKQGEIRQASFEQNDIVNKLDSARKDLGGIMRRGVYNKVYDERAADKLKIAIDYLSNLVGEPNDVSKRGIAALASAHLADAATSRSGKTRTEHFREAADLQSDTIEGITKALEALEKWANYQEVIRITREILEIQRKINQDMRGLDK